MIRNVLSVVLIKEGWFQGSSDPMSDALLLSQRSICVALQKEY